MRTGAGRAKAKTQAYAPSKEFPFSHFVFLVRLLFLSEGGKSIFNH
ncbi:MAG: hypothetical protein JF627_04840 [Alphaproteobacteria bacterium]|nr:hypothetical protein [Alphaproteobacteria bacterium]